MRMWGIGAHNEMRMAASAKLFRRKRIVGRWWMCLGVNKILVEMLLKSEDASIEHVCVRCACSEVVPPL